MMSSPTCGLFTLDRDSSFAPRGPGAWLAWPQTQPAAAARLITWLWNDNGWIDLIDCFNFQPLQEHFVFVVDVVSFTFNHVTSTVRTSICKDFWFFINGCCFFFLRFAWRQVFLLLLLLPLLVFTYTYQPGIYLVCTRTINVNIILIMWLSKYVRPGYMEFCYCRYGYDRNSMKIDEKLECWAG